MGAPSLHPDTDASIAFLGLGAMGRRMARRLLEAGYPLAVWNRTPDRADALVADGARRADTPRDAADGADVVIGMVTDDDASRAVWLGAGEDAGATGAVHGLAEGAVALASSTLTPAWVQTLAGEVAARGAACLDAPVLGTRPQAEAGELIYFVGGDADALARVQPVVDAMGAAVHHVGPTGRGATLKLAVNALFGIQAAALGELLGFLRAAGIDDGDAVDVLGTLPVTSPKAKVVAELMAERTFDPLFPIDLVAKDFRYAVETAEAAGAAVPTTEAVRAVFERARAKGHGDANITGIARLFL